MTLATLNILGPQVSEIYSLYHQYYKQIRILGTNFWGALMVAVVDNCLMRSEKIKLQTIRNGIGLADDYKKENVTKFTKLLDKIQKSDSQYTIVTFYSEFKSQEKFLQASDFLKTFLKNQFGTIIQEDIDDLVLNKLANFLKINLMVKEDSDTIELDENYDSEILMVKNPITKQWYYLIDQIKPYFTMKCSKCQREIEQKNLKQISSCKHKICLNCLKEMKRINQEYTCPINNCLKDDQKEIQQPISYGNQSFNSSVLII